jgi:thymidylate synthase (FAD)
MGAMIQPKVFLVGFTEVDQGGVEDYLKYTKQTDFLADWYKARDLGVSPAECLCSMFAKLCYKSLVPGKNENVSKTRPIAANLRGTFDSGHGSVFEHASMNFIGTDCSRVFTHELVRHRAGTAFSQTSGRYCRLDQIDLVWDPVLDPVRALFACHLARTEDVVYLAECALGLRKPPAEHPAVKADWCLHLRDVRGDAALAEEHRWENDLSFDFDRRKAITSAIRRIAPNGQANEIGFTANIRAIRHIIQLRTARHAEWEIRLVFGQVYELLREKFPLLFYKARVRVAKGLPEVYGMRSNPYEVEPGDPKALEFWETSDLSAELAARQAKAATREKGTA